jgi:tRNA threonylcarbamoyl adenosine modification protein YjeE
LSSRIIAKLTIETPEEMHELGGRLAQIFEAGDLVLLTGPLGAGKTTMTRGVGEAMGAIGNVSSPTFVIARTHRRVGGGPNLVHVDAYRLGTAAELDDLDIDFENSITLVEWGKGLTDGIAENWLEVVIERDHTGETEIRKVTIEGHGDRWVSTVFEAGSN